MGTLKKEIQTVQKTMKSKVKFSPAHIFLLTSNHMNSCLSISPCSGRNINNLRYADDATLMVENEELKAS